MALLVAALTILVSGSYASFRAVQWYGDRFLREAEAQLNIDDSEGAIGALRSHLLNNPGDAQTKVSLAWLLGESGDIESAQRIYVRILKSDSSPSSPEAINGSR